MNKEDLIPLLDSFLDANNKFPTRRELRAINIPESYVYNVFGGLETLKSWYFSLKKTNTKKTNQTTLVVPDAHVGPEQDLTRFELLNKLILDKQPDNIIFMGDFVTLESLSNWDLNKAGVMEGRRYYQDIDAGKEALSLTFNNVKSTYNPNIIYIMGNHECVKYDTEILTFDGWKRADEISFSDSIASFDNDKNISFDNPIAIKKIDNVNMYSVLGNMSDEIVSYNHHVYYNNKLTKVNTLEGTHDITNFTYSGKYEHVDNVEISDEMLRLLTWVICDGTLRQEPCKVKTRVQFHLSKSRKIERLSSILDRIGIEYSLKVATKSGINKLQPYYIRFYSDDARMILKILNGKKEFPTWFKYLNREQANIVLEEIKNTDGQKIFNHLELVTTNKSDADIIQQMCIFNDIPCKIKLHESRSGFKNSKPQYVLSIYNNGVYHKQKKVIIKEEHNTESVIAIQSKNETLITRRNGKVNFTGNCRLERYVETKPELGDHLDIIKDLKLKEFGIDVIVPFREYYRIEGTDFTHVPMNAANQAISGKFAIHRATEITNNSLVFAHTHKKECVNFYRHGADDIVQTTMCGAFFEHTDSYAYGGLNSYWRGCMILTHWKYGRYDVEEFSLERMYQLY